MFEPNNGKHRAGITLAILCPVLLALSFLPKASADDWDKKTVATFGDTVEVPGRALPAGTYVFKLLRNSFGDSHAVQIFDQNEKLIATINAMPVSFDAWRATPSRKWAFDFEERPAPEPQAIKIWLRPGDSVGQEFVYSKNQVKLLARNSPWAVPATTTTEVAEAEKPAATTPSEPVETTEPTVTPSEQAPGTEPQAAPPPQAEQTPDAGTLKDSQETPVMPAPSAEMSPSDNQINAPTNTQTNTLPKTGSGLPLIGLLGTLSLLLAGLCAYRRRALH